MYPNELILKLFMQIIVIRNNAQKKSVVTQILRSRRRMWDNINLEIQRRRNLVVQLMQQNLMLSPNLVKFCFDSKKRIWMKPRCHQFWSETVLKTFQDSDWLQNFRMRRPTFEQLCSILHSKLQPKQLIIKSREPLSVQKQVAVALYMLAKGLTYQVTGSLFGIQKSTVKKCLYNVVNAINEIMTEDYLRMPHDTEATEISTSFANISHIPQIIGCLGYSHVPILAPRERYTDFVNQNKWTSINLQAVVDDKHRFRNVCIRPAGTVGEVIIKGQNLYETAKQIIPQTTKNINGTLVPYLIAANATYSLQPWLLMGYANPITAEEKSFNVYLNSATAVVEKAFARLKSRWKILLTRIDIRYKFVPDVASACCILHNFLEDNTEHFDEQWLEAASEAEILCPQPAQPSTIEQAGSELRRCLTYNLSNLILSSIAEI